MQQVQLADKLYSEAQRRALEAGFPSVDEYIADVVSHDLRADDDEEEIDQSRIFTPERLAEIDKAVADIKAGNYLTSEQVDEHFRKRFAESKQKGARK